MIAMSILFVGWRYVTERRLVKYMLLVAVAMLFHTTSVIAVALYFLYGLKWDRVLLFVPLAEIFLLVLGRPVVMFALRLLPKYAGYVKPYGVDLALYTVNSARKAEEYFDDKLTQEIESTVLTPNINGNPEIGNIKLVSDELTSIFVKSFCQDHSISPNVLFMTATILSLNKFTFNSKSLITTIFNGRANSDYFDTQGMLVKTLPIIVNGENREMMVEDYIKIVDKAWKDALTHSNYPYTKLAEDYQLKPEFFYAYHESFNDEIILDGKKYKTIDLDGTVATDYKINLDVFDDGENISLYIEYNNQIYTEEYVNMFLRSIKYVLFQFFVNDMDKLKINDIELK